MGKCGMGGIHRAAAVLGAKLGHRAQHRAAGRIGHVEIIALRPRDPCAIDIGKVAGQCAPRQRGQTIGGGWDHLGHRAPPWDELPRR